MEIAHTALWIVALLTGLLFASRECTAANWTVGDASGWNLGVDYSQWPQGKNFRPGDNFLFSYNKTRHNVLEVSEADLSTCTTANPIGLHTDGNTSVLIGNVSTHFYICGTPGHCLDGMSLVIAVTNGSSPAPTPSPVPSPSAAPSISTPSPSSTPSASSVPSSGSTSPGTESPSSLASLPSTATTQSRGGLMVLVAAIFLSVGLIFKAELF